MPECAHCGEWVGANEMVEWYDMLMHPECAEEARTWLEDAMDSDRRSYVSAIGSGQR